MSRCPTINFQFSIMSKCLSKHISTKDSFKINIRKIHVTFSLVDLAYKSSVSILEFEMIVLK